jgi:hypothetical protein
MALRKKGSLGAPAPEGMRKVRLLSDAHYGKGDDPPEVPAGTVMDVPEAQAERWVDSGVAVELD